jgi:hypothetical protein
MTRSAPARSEFAFELADGVAAPATSGVSSRPGSGQWSTRRTSAQPRSTDPSRPRTRVASERRCRTPRPHRAERETVLVDLEGGDGIRPAAVDRQVRQQTRCLARLDGAVEAATEVPGKLRGLGRGLNKIDGLLEGWCKTKLPSNLRACPTCAAATSNHHNRGSRRCPIGCASPWSDHAARPSFVLARRAYFRQWEPTRRLARTG